MGSMQCNVEFEYKLSICSGTKKNLDRVGGSQDLPDANWSPEQHYPLTYVLVFSIAYFPLAFPPIT
jgi:hypothetical protein